MAHALEAGEVAAQQLAAPDRPVRAVAGAVENERQRRAGLAVLGQAGGGMGVVVLHFDQLQLLSARPLAGEVVGMEIAGQKLRLDSEHRQVELQIGPEGAVGQFGIEVAEVRREKGLVAADDAEGALELGARCQQRRAGADR